MPVAEDNTTSRYTVGNHSVLVKNIMTVGGTDNKENAKMAVYARPYVKLSDGTAIYGDTVSVTLQRLVYAADAKWDSLTAAQKQTLQDMFATYRTIMAKWKIPNIKNAQ